LDEILLFHLENLPTLLYHGCRVLTLLNFEVKSHLVAAHKST
jgi:hypothetical protein